MDTAERSSAPVSLDQDFYARPARRVARELLGKVLVRQIAGQRQLAVIHEVEAYVGPHDLACHAAKGRTERTEVMFGPAGIWYVYFIYGIHWMLNVVTEREGYPAAVLIRGAGNWTGPARLTKALAIDKSFNGRRAAPDTSGHTQARGSGGVAADGLWIEDRGLRLPRGCIASTPRIGVEYAGSWAEKPYRYVIDTPAAQQLQRQVASVCPE